MFPEKLNFTCVKFGKINFMKQTLRLAYPKPNRLAQYIFKYSYTQILHSA